MLTVVYRDNHLLVLDKPGGLLTQPSGTRLDSLERQAKDWLKETCGKPGNVFLEAVHRIDRVACGIVLFARTSKALARLNAAIRSGACRKEYYALVEGVPGLRRGELRHWMLHGDHEARIVSPMTPGAKEAVLSYECLEQRSDGITLLKIQLETGRYHQIRAQLASCGHPILGDRLYGAVREYHPGSIALQHHALTLEHPVTHQQMTFVACHSL